MTIYIVVVYKTGEYIAAFRYKKDAEKYVRLNAQKTGYADLSVQVSHLRDTVTF